MPETSQTPYRLIITRSGAEVLLRRTGSATGRSGAQPWDEKTPPPRSIVEHIPANAWTLPEIRISGNTRPAAAITDAVKRELGLTALCLGNDTLNTGGEGVSHGGSPFYQVMEARDPDWEVSQGLSWYNSKIAEDFLPGDQAIKVDCALKGLVLGGPFGRLGWLDCLRSKLASRISPRKFTGKFDQLNISEHFSLVRLETTGKAVWFKATGHPNTHEHDVTLMLAREFPWALPEVVADVPEWNGWACEDSGESLREHLHLRHLETAVQVLARLQVECIGKTESLLAAGAISQRLEEFLEDVDEFFEAVEELMRLQPKAPPLVLDRKTLRETAETIKETCHHAMELNVPDTLMHGDLNLGSILVTQDGSIIGDWCETYVGFPFLTFEHLIAHLEREQPGLEGWHAPLRNAYRSVWASVLTDSQMDEIFPLLPLLAVFTYALGRGAWRDKDRRLQPELAKYYRSLARRMHREAEVLHAKGVHA